MTIEPEIIVAFGAGVGFGVALDRWILPLVILRYLDRFRRERPGVE